MCLRGIRPDCRSRRQRRSNKLSEPDPSHRRRRVHRIELHPLPTSLLARRGDHQSGSAQLLREPREPQGPARCFSPHLRQRGCRRLGPGRGSAAAAPHRNGRPLRRRDPRRPIHRRPGGLHRGECRGHIPPARGLPQDLAASGARTGDPGDGCPCRKPPPGLILEAAREHNLDLRRSILLGAR